MTTKGGTMTICTTLNEILAHNRCGQDPADACGWWLLLNHLGKTEADDEPLPLAVILESNGLDDCLWALCCLGPEHEGWIHKFARECASDVLHLWDAPQVVKDYLATGDESLREAARAAARADAGEAASAAAWAATSAAAWAASSDAAWDAASSAAWTASSAAAWDAARAASSGAAWDAVWAAARAAAKGKQAERIRRYLVGARP